MIRSAVLRLRTLKRSMIEADLKPPGELRMMPMRVETFGMNSIGTPLERIHCTIKRVRIGDAAVHLLDGWLEDVEWNAKRAKSQVSENLFSTRRAPALVGERGRERLISPKDNTYIKKRTCQKASPNNLTKTKFQ